MALYETVAEPIDEALAGALAEVDYLTFTSSSTVRYFLESAAPGPATRIASIGPVTSATLRESGLGVDVEAARHDIDGVDRGDRRRQRGAGGRAMSAVPLVTFLSDYGSCDEFVGVCHGVIARRCPRARIIDLGHGIARHDVRAGALALRAALPLHAGGRAPRGRRPRRRRCAARGRAATWRRRTARWSDPTTGCLRSPPSISAAPSRPSTSPTPLSCCCPSAPPSTVATCSRRSRRRSRTARRSRRSGIRSTPPASRRWRCRNRGSTAGS